MFEKIKKHLERKRNAKNYEEWLSGYDWACGNLIRGEHSYQSIKALIDFNQLDNFDKGALKACDDLVKFGIINQSTFW